tara:strand:- start:1077 stop:3254 length:2178 start_codon:yes stop_codon:yes gene_type:complete
MKTDTLIVAVAGGLEESLPQQIENAGRAENWIAERRTGGWSSRLGYEPYQPGAITSFNPFASDKPVYGLHCAQGLAGGARQHVLYSEGGNLNLLYESNGALMLKRTLQTGRNVPAPTEPGPQYLDTPHGILVTNGYDAPVLVTPWPLGNAAESDAALSSIIRPFGFTVPAPPQPRRVQPMTPAATPASSQATGGGATTLWCLTDGKGIADGGRWGVGFRENTGTAPKQVLLGYAVSHISDTGSEGPRSSIQSTSFDVPNDANSKGFRYAVTLELAPGAPGTVARKVYRTANYSEDGAIVGDTSLYFAGLIRNNVDEFYFDPVRAADLGEAAPLTAGGPFPAPRARFSGMFRQCLFLDGGVEDPFTLFYSAPSRIEQFSALQSLELGSDGGGITALYGDYTLLVVFRERGIDVVQGNFADGFNISTLSRTLRCHAPGSVQRVPGLGVVFLAVDGVYALVGGLTGGAVADVVKLSAGYDRTIERITPDCHARAVSCYSTTAREYQLHVPVDGNDRCNLGLVMHVDKLQRAPDLSAWSTRTGFPVGALSTTFNGAVLFGHNVNDEGGATDERGIFVISGKRAMGGTIPAQGSFTAAAPPVSVYRSAWCDFGDAQLLKQVQYVTLWVMTTGNPTVTIKWYKDFDLTGTTERTYVMQPPDKALLPVFDTAVLDSGAVYRDERLVPLRYAVAVQSCSHFCFEVSTSDDVVLIGYEYGYSVRGTEIARGRRA